MRRVLHLLSAAGILGVAVAGCGGSSTMGPSGTTAPAAATPPTRSAPAPAPARAPAGAQDWPTYHGSGARAGAAASGPPLGRVRHIWSTRVAGAVYAEPLLVGGRVLVATEKNIVYALDASSGRRLWVARLGTPVSGGSLPCGNLDPSGITGTPVVDLRRQTLYVVAYRQGFRHVLVALDVRTGATRFERPVDPPSGDVTTQQQRSALALSHGRVYVSYGGLYGDCGRYHGWVIGVSASTATGPLISYRVPSENEGAIWAPSGPAVDSRGDLYVATGNGSSSSFDYGNAVIRLSAGLQARSFFAPKDAGALSTTDTDLGSTGPVLLSPSRGFIIGKSGTGYLFRRPSLGGLGHSIAALQVAPAFGGDAFSAGTLYIPTTDGIAAVRVHGDHLTRVWRQSAATLPPIVAGPGVWALSAGGTLYQLDPGTGTVRYQAQVGEPAHFATPAAGDGRVYVAAGGTVAAFG